MTSPDPRMNAPVVATITAADAARTRWQVLVIGGGPAGAAAALRLAAGGARVLLVDRGGMPRWKVCGCCLSVAAVQELQLLDCGMGDDSALPFDAVPLESVCVAHGGRSAVLPLPGGGVVSREVLDAGLVAAAIAAGCHWLPQAHVASIDDGAAGSQQVTATLTMRPPADAIMTSHVITADRIVLATGLADHVRIATLDPACVSHTPEDARRIAADNRIGLGATLPAHAADLPFGELVMAVGRDGYCGVVRLEDGRLDIAAAVSRESLGRGADPGRVVAAIVAAAVGRSSLPMPTTATLSAAAFRATPPLTRSAPLISGPRGQILRCGDAAGYVEPFTGEGIGWALASGRLVAEALLDDEPGAGAPLRSPAAAAARYRESHHRRIAAVHARCRRVALALRRPGVVMAAVQAARVAPWAARRFVPAVIGAGSLGGHR